MSGRRGTSIALSLLCALAAGALALQATGRLYVPAPPSRPAIAERTFTAQPLVLEVAFPPAETFDEIAERPLFSETRAPPRTVAEAEPALPTERDLFTLLGVAISDASRIAIVQAKKNGEISQVAVGDRLGGWSVRDIRPRSLLLADGVREHLVELQEVARDRPPPRPPSASGLVPLPQQPSPSQAGGAPPPPPAPAGGSRASR